MQTKLQELTDKIYQEGVAEANKEAEKILSKAKKDAQSHIAKAKKEAEELMAHAEKDAEELKKNTLNELQLSARQALSDLKQKVVSLIETKTIKPETSKAFKNEDFILDVIKTIVENWNPESGEPVQLEAILPKSQQKDIQAYFKTKAGAVLDKQLEVSFSDKIKNGFKIGPKDGGYQVSFSDDDFENFFQAYLRPRLIELLFKDK